MSKSIMYDLFYGNLVPCARGRVQDPAYTLISRKIDELKTHIKQILPPEEYQKFEEMENLFYESGTFEDIDLFEYGFCMGALIMIDVINFKNCRLTERNGALHSF